VLDQIGRIVGVPLQLDELKVKPGRRRTLRARGSRMTAIVKIYATPRAAVVAQRIAALSDGPAEPLIPRVLHVDQAGEWLVLSEVPGRALREAVTAADSDACHRAGAALGRWHAAWHRTAPAALRPHTVEREIDILRQRAAAASPAVRRAVDAVIPGLLAGWESVTVVHRDLYEEQLLIGERVGLIDLDDAAVGPPELDVGNLLGHVALLGWRRRLDVAPSMQALLAGYAAAGSRLHGELLERCRTLSLLRLACLNDEVRLIDLALANRVRLTPPQ